MQRVVFLDRGTVPIPLPTLSFAHEWVEFGLTEPSEVRERLQGATIAITNKVPLRATDLEALPNLKMIAVAATGYDCVDAAWCKSHGIVVSNIPRYAKQSVAEHVFMMMLALRRNLPAYQAATRDGFWQSAPHFSLPDFPISDLAGATLGLIGYGSIAAELERRAQAFGMTVWCAERRGAASIRPGRKSFDDVLRQADVISLHAPSTPETRHLIGAAELSTMRPHAILINTARGALVDAEALAEALRMGRLGGAGIDVLEEEPPRKRNPLLDPALPNVIVTPHVAWCSQDALASMVKTLFGNIEAFAAGKPANGVP